MFKVVDGAVPAGGGGRIDLFVRRNEATDATVATWDRTGVTASGKGSVRVRRIETLGLPVEEAYRQAFTAAREADIPLCIFDNHRLFPKASRPKIEGEHEA